MCSVKRRIHPPCGNGLPLNICPYSFALINDFNYKDYCLKRSCSEAVSSTINSECYNEWLEKVHTNAAFLVVNNEDVLGCAAIYVNDYKYKTAYLTYIAVAAGHQNQNIGIHLMKKLENIALASGMKKLKLEVKKINHKAIHFYKWNGFDIVDTSEESFYMIKNL